MTILDPLLLNLLHAAERGEKCPPLVAIVGTWVVQGTLVSTAGFLEATQQHFRERMLRLTGIKDGNTPDAVEEAAQMAARRLSPLGNAGDAEPLALNILDATLANATTISVPAIRVPISAVDSWWVTNHHVEGQKASSERGRGGRGGGGIGFEVAF